jgi:hypothetical protein
MKHIKKYESFLSKSLGTAALAVTGLSPVTKSMGQDTQKTNSTEQEISNWMKYGPAGAPSKSTDSTLNDMVDISRMGGPSNIRIGSDVTFSNRGMDISFEGKVKGKGITIIADKPTKVMITKYGVGDTPEVEFSKFEIDKTTNITDLPLGIFYVYINGVKTTFFRENVR